MVIIVNITISIRREESDEGVLVTLVGYSLWLEFQASVLTNTAELGYCAQSP